MSNPAVALESVGKMYKLYPSRSAHLADTLGLGRLLPAVRSSYREFWALRGVDLVLEPGDRVGIIGRNGAGKSTLLKLMTGNLAPTEGTVTVAGEVQALLDAAGGFHPEFTGRENIRAALTFRGVAPAHIREAESEIAQFTELDDFLDQPFKTYSLGMQTRLSFAVATTVRPEILIIDEMLGAGDGYFLAKSTERMRSLVSSGATVLLVTHAMEQVLMFCDRAVWLDRGEIVDDGPALAVCKAYDRYIKMLEDRRLRARNRKARSGVVNPALLDGYADQLVVRFTVEGAEGEHADVSEVVLTTDGESEGVVPGQPQDADGGQSAYVVLPGCRWSPPMSEESIRFRRISSAATPSPGNIVFRLLAWNDDADWEVAVTYRATAHARVTLEVVRGESVLARTQLPPSAAWAIDVLSRAGATAVAELELSGVPAGGAGEQVDEADGEGEIQGEVEAEPARVISRWPGEGSITIERVDLRGADARSRAVYRVGDPMRISVQGRVHRSGRRTVIPVAVIFRRDGILVTRHIGREMEIEGARGDEVEFTLSLGPLNLGNGFYVVSIALYARLDVDEVEEPQIYDLHDRSYEFEVFGLPPLVTGIFQHPGEWSSHVLSRSDG